MRVYIAGKYSASNIIQVLENIRIGQRAGTELLLRGYEPFTPWHDYHFSLQCRGDEQVSITDYYRYSMAWLRVSEAVLVLPGWENSVGTRAEIDEATRLDIPVFYSVDGLDAWRTYQNG